MPVPRQGPFTEKDYAAFNKALDELAQFRVDLELAEKAGLNCTEQTQMCDFLKSRFEALKSAYFPDRP